MEVKVIMRACSLSIYIHGAGLRFELQAWACAHPSSRGCGRGREHWRALESVSMGVGMGMSACFKAQAWAWARARACILSCKRGRVHTLQAVGMGVGLCLKA